MKIAIHQPNYLPWCGYFSKMKSSDIFVFLDDVEISPGQSYVYRTKILTKNGPIWLSIPCHRSTSMLIKNVEIYNNGWNKKHLRSISESYRKTPFFDDFFPRLEKHYINPDKNLSLFNIKLIKEIIDYLSIDIEIKNSSEIDHSGKSDARLISITKSIGASTYLSGKGGMNYQHPDEFIKEGITLRILEYKPLSYPQVVEGFIPGLSIIDAIFNLGKNALKVLQY